MLKFLLSYLLLLVPMSALADTAKQTDVRAADPTVQVLINELGLRESELASRDIPGWSPAQKIVVRQGRPGALEEYQALAPEVDFVMVESVEQARIEAVDAQAVLGYCDEEMLSKAPGLFWIQVYSAGVERCVDNPSIQSGNRLLTNGQNTSL